MNLKRLHATRASQRRGGFTLLELTAVIFIVVVLVGLLVTALDGTRKRSLQITCQGSNMRQLSLAWILYADDNEDEIALNRTASGPTPSQFLGMRLSTNSWVAGNPKEDKTMDNLRAGTLFPYLRTTDIYRCPSDASTVLNSSQPRNRSYAMSAYMNGDNAATDRRVKQKLGDITTPSPSQTFVLIEEHEDSIWGSSFLVLPRESFPLMTGSWNSTPAQRHTAGCNIAFADGHVEHWKWSWPKQGNLVNLSTSNVRELNDLRRLQNAIPKP